jgi:Domain of unknown function (DUF222)
MVIATGVRMGMGIVPCVGIAIGDVRPPSSAPSPANDLQAAVALPWLLDLEPGPAAMAVLAGIDPAGLDQADRVALVAAWDRQNSWVAAQSQAVLAVAVGLEPTTEDDWVRDEIALALKMSGRSARNRMHVARVLAGSLPGTHRLLESGQLSVRHAFAMVELCAGVSDAVAARVEARVLAKAPHQDVGHFRRSVRRALIALNPIESRDAHEIACAERNVQLVPEPNGMASVVATLPAIEARALFLAVDALARARHQAAGGRASGVGIGARRADALMALADAALADRRLPKTHGRRVELQVVIDAATLLALADNPAELIGYGPVPPHLARELAGDARWRRLVTDPVSGQLLDYGRRSYKTPQPLADYVAARDVSCRIPGCRCPATLCDIDHVRAFAQGGQTASHNCISLCRRHHRAKTKRLWKLDFKPDGSITLTTRAGMKYRLRAPDQNDP